MKTPLLTALDILIFTFLLVGDKFLQDYYFHLRGLMIIFSSYLFLTAPHKQNWKIIKSYIVPVSLFFIIGLGHMLWINMDNSSVLAYMQIFRGSSIIFQNFIFLYLSIALFLKYDIKALNIACLSFIIAYTICIINGIVILGPIGLLKYSVDFSDAKLAESDSINEIFEVHSLGLTFPFFIFLHMFISKTTKVNIFKRIELIILVFYTLLSMKRIAILALFATYFGYVIVSKQKKKYALVNNVRYIIIIISIILIWFIYLPSFFDIAHEHAKLLMGRDYLYTKIIEESYFSIDYLGKGWGWVSAYMQYRNEMDNFFVGVAGLHNDVLRTYIECGFVGFLIYNYIYYIIIPNKLKIINKDLFLIYLVIQIFAWFTYLTDNTYQYWDFQTVLIISPFIIFKIMSQRRILPSYT